MKLITSLTLTIFFLLSTPVIAGAQCDYILSSASSNVRALDDIYDDCAGNVSARCGRRLKSWQKSWMNNADRMMDYGCSGVTFGSKMKKHTRSVTNLMIENNDYLNELKYEGYL